MTIWKFRAPPYLPSLEQLLDGFGNPDAATLAKFLGVTVRSVYGWKKAGTAPRTVLLALFYESPQGQAMMAAESHNAAMYARALAGSAERENAALRARISRLERIADFGAANAPTLEQTRPIGAVAMP